MLGFHVGFVDAGGCGEGVLRAIVFAEEIEDVSGHVDHVSAGGCEGAEFECGGARKLRMVAGFDDVNPVVKDGGVVWMLLHERVQYVLRFLRAGVGVAVEVAVVE